MERIITPALFMTEFISKTENAVTLHSPGTHPWIFFIDECHRYKWIVAVERHLYTFDNEQDAREYFVLRNLEY